MKRTPHEFLGVQTPVAYQLNVLPIMAEKSSICTHPLAEVRSQGYGLICIGVRSSKRVGYGRKNFRNGYRKIFGQENWFVPLAETDRTPETVPLPAGGLV